VPRTVKEWIGKTPDAKIPDEVKLRIVLRGEGKCAGPCKRKFGPKLTPEFDHRPALCNGGEHRESQIFAVCFECHLDRTKEDLSARAKTKRMQKTYFGIKRKPTRPWVRHVEDD
jgi:5-methylcytosine-specific restriction protein A